MVGGRSPEPEFLVVGHVSKAHGTKGEILIWPLTDRPDEVFAAGRRVLLGDDAGVAGEPPEEVVVEAARPYRRGLLAKFEGATDRNDAERLAGRYLLIPAAESGDAAADELYYHQLLGLVVETAGGDVVGRVREVFETEPDHLLEVKGEADGEARVHLVPFNRRLVKRIDLEAGRLVIDPPAGLLEL